MGMTGDFELAIAEGSTMVRIGTGIFGPRRSYWMSKRLKADEYEEQDGWIAQTAAAGGSGTSRKRKRKRHSAARCLPLR